MSSDGAVAVVNNSPEQLAGIRAACPRVRTYAVPHKTRKRERLPLPLAHGQRKHGSAPPVIDLGAGINATTVRKLLAESEAGDTVLFDWGRTLVQVKGVDFSQIGKGAAAEEAALRWAVGGAARLRLLRRLFAGLRARGVHLGMLSNSGNCGAAAWKRLVYRLTGTRHIAMMCGDGPKWRRISRRWRQPALCNRVAD